MMGRLIRLDGKLKNNPSVRFGHLAMLPQSAPHPRGLKQESFVVEMMSIGGYSGSPVFIYEHQTILPGDTSMRFPGLRLLGINWGHHPTTLRVYEKLRSSLEKTDLWVKSNSGMANVAPAWKIKEAIEEHARVQGHSS